MRDLLDVLLTVAARREQRGEPGQIGDGVEVGRALFAAEPAVEIGADAAVAGVAGDLADVIDVIADGLERDAGALGRRLAADPAGTIIQASNAAPITAPRWTSS